MSNSISGNGSGFIAQSDNQKTSKQTGAFETLVGGAKSNNITQASSVVMTNATMDGVVAHLQESYDNSIVKVKVAIANAEVARDALQNAKNDRDKVNSALEENA